MSSSVQFYLAIFIFLMTYAGIMSEKIHRTICALAGGGAMIYFGLVTQEQAITEFIDFNTLMENETVGKKLRTLFKQI